MSLEVKIAALQAGRFPRVSGDEPEGQVTYTDPVQFSPRERG